MDYNTNQKTANIVNIREKPNHLLIIKAIRDQLIPL